MIELRNVSKSFKNKSVFGNVNVSFIHNKVYAVLGDSGTGKTTLFQILFGLDHKYSGDYFLFGKNTKELSNKDWNYLRSSVIQIVYQDFKLLENLTVFENLYYACNEINLDTIKNCENLLIDMKLDDLKNKKVSQLSGGEKQRVSFARSLVNSPKIILLDEPTGNLDNTNTKIILNYIQKLNERGAMVIIITHDNRVIPICDLVYKIEDRKIVNDNNLSISEEAPQCKSLTLLKKFKHFSFKYMISSMKHNILDIMLSNIPIMALFIVFIVVFSVMWSSTVDSLDKFYNGLSPDGIYISSNTFKDEYVNKLLKKVKSIKGVKAMS